MDKKQCDVSVVCITYNHANYIAKAIESFLCQETDFEYEIIVHDDASTDKTGEIIQELCLQNPGRISYIRQPKNMYSQGVRILETAYSYASGKFIASCEGDDFWNDSKKLQKQFEYMSLHPDCGALFSDADILDQKTGNVIFSHDAARNFFPPIGDVKKKLLMGNPYKSCTVMLRRDAAEGYALHAKKLQAKMDDYVLWLHIANRYKIGYLSESLATYRILPNSASHFSNNIGKIRFDRSAYRVSVYFNQLMGGIVDRSSIKTNYAYSLFSFFLQTGKPLKAFGYINCSFEFLRLLFSGFVRKVLLFKNYLK